jgi:hypothetical protein
MRRTTAAAPIAVLFAAMAGSCTDISTSATRAVALEFDSLPFPAVVTGDTLRDSLGRAAPLRALAFNSSGAIIAGAGTQYIALDTGLTIDASGIVTAQGRGGQVRIVATVNGIQTLPPEILLIARRPDSVFATSTQDTTLLFSIPDSATVNVTGPLTVRVATNDTVGNVIGTQGWLVSYQLSYHGSPVPPADTSRVSLWAPDGTRATTIDTTAADGSASRRLRVRSLLLSTQLDSFIVVATVQYRGAPVRGSPVQFVVHVKAR